MGAKPKLLPNGPMARLLEEKAQWDAIEHQVRQARPRRPLPVCKFGGDQDGAKFQTGADGFCLRIQKWERGDSESVELTLAETEKLRQYLNEMAGQNWAEWSAE